MVRLIMGAAGAGKTKQLIELIHASVAAEKGSVVCIEQIVFVVLWTLFKACTG